MQIVIRDIIRQKMEDGQLDQSPLTFSDLHKISDAFEVVLRGAVSHRIEYPTERSAEQPDLPSPGPGPELVGAKARNGRAK